MTAFSTASYPLVTLVTCQIWGPIPLIGYLAAISYTPPWSPPPVFLQSPTPHRLLMESISTQGMFHKMHLQGLEHTISCIKCLCKQLLPLPLDHRVLKYLTNGFHICNISSNSVICILKEFSVGNVCLSIS